ncbi:transcriptional corepressor LEUNIG_HOMOLOG-like isoform X1 [Hibiscus syriacus]|uniref:transcriptional corepressor LEUNIG_HOMOLOG-like isoform X1 n=1 Tax=Hibiscus syriacus TaxID=106335 RepID=UPI001921BCC1|nr:transcriptional corepressor LEUNIG_HOMOLOG-like isoform X1 [Hibiscus syriacus]
MRWGRVIGKQIRCLMFIYDYLVKKKLHTTAKSFMTEGKVAPDPVAIDAPGGFLFEWWSVFWDIFISRTNDKHSEAAAAYIEAQQIKAKEQQQLQMQQLQLMRQAQLQRRDPNNPSWVGPVNAIGSEGMLGQSNASALAAKMYEERMKQPNAANSETSQPLLDARMALLKSATNHPGQLVQGNHGNVIAALQQIQDIKGEVNLGGTQRSMHMDPSSIYGQGIMQSKPGMGNTGLSPGVGSLPLKGWPLTGIDQIRPNLGAQVQKPFLQNANQFQLLPQQQQQQLLAQVQTQGNLGNSPMYGDMDPQRFSGLSRGNLNTREGQPTANDGSIVSPMQSTSSKQMSMPPIRQSSSQQDPLQSPQVQQNNRKRKGPSSGPANSTGTGNTVGPSSNSQPSTPSTHTPAEGAAMVGNMQHGSSLSKKMMYGSDGTAGIASSTNQLEDMENFGDVGSLDDNVESFLSPDDGDGGNLFGTLKRNPSEHTTETSKNFGFNEVGSIRKSNSKVTCCHFSSDGKLLASAGHDKKVVLCNMETLQTDCTAEEHTHIITDIRFRPNSTQLATSSFDTTVRVWDAAQPSYSIWKYTGHTAQVMSLDFHPKKTELFCSCDGNSEIRFWNINQYSCTRISKGGSTNVRFQPRIGQFLAAAADNVVSIFDVETDRRTQLLQGHNTEVHSLCWDANGDFLASVSQESVRLWSLSSGECIHELNSSGNKFHSCVFHPNFPALLVIGGYQSLELWNTAVNKCLTISAHDCVVSALAQSQVTGIVASASYDKSVKIWK